MNDSFGRDKAALSQMKPSHQGHTGRERGRGRGRGTVVCMEGDKFTKDHAHPITPTCYSN